jgi:site-specific DNA-methyltransferase (adenine-specific)
VGRDKRERKSGRKKARRHVGGENLLYAGDAGHVAEALPPEVSLDLVYLDPPYSVGTTMRCRDEPGQMRGRAQKKSGRAAYDDRADPEALLAHLEPRLAQIRERMSDKATLYLHMDYRAIHEAKVACDRVFGRSCFLGDVCWAPGNGARGARGFSVTHQTLLLYAKKGRRHVVHNTDHPLLREPYAETSLAMHFKKRDEEGRRYRERKVNGKTYRYYADEGRRLGSVWTDIPAMVANTPLRKEGTGYPTQKPEKLLERIIRLSSDSEDVVGDLMCGSGTTLVVAARLGRRFVGGDASAVAIEITRARLGEAGVGYDFAELEDGDPSR